MLPGLAFCSILTRFGRGFDIHVSSPCIIQFVPMEYNLWFCRSDLFGLFYENHSLAPMLEKTPVNIHRADGDGYQHQRECHQHERQETDRLA